MESSQFSDSQSHFESIEQVDAHGVTCNSFRVKLYGKLHFLKRLKPEFVGDVRYQEAIHKEFETGYRLEHPNLVRYISLTDDGILMEYVDGQTLSQLLTTHPDYFLSRRNMEKFLRQLLSVVGFLHSHQVLHLDLKPDNILLTRIGHDVKLIDLGFCYTDTFTDTLGHTVGFAAPEQLSGGNVDERTDIYAIGKILQLLPTCSIYNKVIARSTATDPLKRYQSAEEMLHALNSRGKSRNAVLVAVLVAVLAVIIATFAVIPQNKKGQKIMEKTKDTVATQFSVAPQKPVSHHSSSQPFVSTSRQTMPYSVDSVSNDRQKKMESELDHLVDEAYRSTIASFCDSVFPSQTVGRQWERKSSEFHAETLRVAADLSHKYPDIPESVIIQHVEQRFQNLVGYVFNRMRENGKKNTVE